MEYVLKSGAGVLTENARQIAALVCDWLKPANPTLAEMARKARAQGRPRAALDHCD